MSYFFAKLQIPQDWTGEQAHAVVELLETITAAIWDVHELKIIDAMHKQISTPQRTPEYCRHPSDDDFPF